ncbi:MAG: NUDIX domain-containing protein [Chloroflexi bacterium]|nr:NUDIX domain-containing protein [Chloroflexota bacterium]MCI0647019.1 NUDIX domain-containing protein [Chloroflexota bacterium]MCI0730719.1 NUDIX domain-containing protein [Chloroflexota bacterium]
MFDVLSDLPVTRRWRGQAYPLPVVGALIHQAGRDGDCLLLIRRKSNPYAGHWALVGGKWDFGETLAAAIRREVKEETGLDATFVALRGLVSERLVPAEAATDGAAHFLIFVCEVAAAAGEAREQAEGAVAWFNREEIDQLHVAAAIIPSDYAMIQRFAGSAVALPHIEADMVAGLGPTGGDNTRLVRFE